MRMISVRLLPVAVLILGLMGLAGPVAAAAPSAADQFLAAGAGSDFTAAVGSTTFQDESCFTDPAGDEVSLEGNVAATEPRADIVEHCVDFGVDTLLLSVEVSTPTDPATDPNWAGSAVGWFIDIDSDDNGEFFAQVSQNADTGVPEAKVDDRSTEPASTACDATYGFADGQISVEIDVACIDDPESVGVSPGVIYDQRVSDPEGRAIFDKAPNGADFEQPVDADVIDAEITRLEGPERMATAIEVSQFAFGDGEASAVVLARQDGFADAQAGTPLALDEDAPVLLTTQDTLFATTATEIQRVLPAGGTVFLLGGEVALSAQVEADITALGFQAVRYGGVNRFETAAIIASQGLDAPDTVIITDGGNFADAVIAGPASAPLGNAAILLSDDDRVPAETQAYLDANTPDTLITIGTGATGAFPEADTTFEAGSPATLSVAVAEGLFTNPPAVGIATDRDFPDALAGGALLGREDIGPGPILLTSGTELDPAVEAYLEDEAADIDDVIIFGGDAAINEEVEDDIAAALS